jgi:hypothetical protein
MVRPWLSFVYCYQLRDLLNMYMPMPAMNKPSKIRPTYGRIRFSTPTTTMAVMMTPAMASQMCRIAD